MEVVLVVSLVVVALGLGLGLGLRKTVQPQVSCRRRCNETFSKEIEDAGCSCDDKCSERGTCCWDYYSTCVVPREISWLKDACTSFNTPQCPTGLHGSMVYPGAKSDETKQETASGKLLVDAIELWFDRSPLILFSMDGFRAEYLETWSALLPNIAKLKNCGTHSKYMRAVYPTKTFTNHYSIVTGLYAESHGIIDNNMYDVHLNKSFSLSGSEKSNPVWWSGQPIWHTAMYQGLKAGTYFWPGSDVKINGSFPNIYKLYNKSITYEKRVTELLQWLELPKSERPDFYTLYIEEPDSSGHSYGPLSGGTIKALQLADQTLGMLMEGLKQRNLHKCVNLILLADHGMDKTFCDKIEFMADYLDNINFYMYEGPAPRIRSGKVPLDFFTFDSEGIVKNLTCRKPQQHFKAYMTRNLPKRLHYANNIRIDKVNLMVDRQWLAVKARPANTRYCGGGNHGYDNEFKSMEAIFVAHGPGFKEKIEVKPFENIEVYNLMCDLLKIQPAPNNGTHGSLNHLLKVPFYTPSPAKEESPPSSYPVSPSPSSNVSSGCNLDSITDLNAVNQRLNLTDKAIMEAKAHHLPYGRPQVLQQGSTYYLLYQDKYVSGYSTNILMPLWSSYSVSQTPGHVPSPSPPVPDGLRPDVRIPASQSQNCSSYQPDLNITHGFLYPPNISSSGIEQYDALVTSNIVPMYKEFKRLWDYVHDTLLPKYAEERNGLNVISGPIFDYNSDGHFDPLAIITEYVANTNIPIPTHYFIVLTSCENRSQTPVNCSGSLDVQPFILPHRPDNTESCGENVPAYLWAEERIQAHAARVRDVELLTGLDFYQGSGKPLPEILQLKTFLPTFETLIY
ncbi:Venom phosphodiesterase 1 [Varanus komodoensis]|nr:Venom phosphodiesterase 1 [Varanus komodoensis]